MARQIYEPNLRELAGCSTDELVGCLVYGGSGLARDVLLGLRGATPLATNPDWWRGRCRAVARQLPKEALADTAQLVAILAAEIESRRTEVGL